MPFAVSSTQAQNLELTNKQRKRVREKVRASFKYYFSTSNLCRDMLLRSCMDEQGWVLLSRIASFERIQHATVDPKTGLVFAHLPPNCAMGIIRDAVQDLELVEMDLNQTSVRARGDWQNWIPDEKKVPNRNTKNLRSL
eukprot:gnl/MRDRNA2_/MRDRNA2_231485_c0_seq1.p1 gnl/MRDRNA2_/MRDRNA2_231485_c0~~gnl/MRDRNA2_/MRDRNA2_231485_c0_seq1.p1  ORF type:complete len:155 (-),score=26.78 gnl/MRDRNA2_/MRDRNA2_231485_c0_seq1:772-1188(-)